MTTESKTVYLSKDGKVSGPFSESEIEAFGKSGEIHQYSWIWYGAGRSWEPLSAPPPPPDASAKTSRVPSAPVASAKPVASTKKAAEPAPAGPRSASGSRLRSVAERKIQAICHDNRHVISGFVSQISRDEFVLMSPDHLSGMPPFRKGGKVVINLLDESAGKTENVHADILAFDKKGTHWEYKMKWEKVPQFFVNDVTKA